MRISDWSSDVCSSDLLTRIAPNVDISGGIAGQLQGQISIRGISTLVRNIGLETGVGIYVDGVYVGRPENFVQHLLDIDRVEIARGPQGTEYGKKDRKSTRLNSSH